MNIRGTYRQANNPSVLIKTKWNKVFLSDDGRWEIRLWIKDWQVVRENEKEETDEATRYAVGG